MHFFIQASASQIFIVLKAYYTTFSIGDWGVSFLSSGSLWLFRSCYEMSLCPLWLCCQILSNNGRQISEDSFENVLVACTLDLEIHNSSRRSVEASSSFFTEMNCLSKIFEILGFFVSLWFRSSKLWLKLKAAWPSTISIARVFIHFSSIAFCYGLYPPR